jgi:uncharacterized sulfatase
MLLWMTPELAAREKPADKPNVVYIISDDQAWTDFGFMGHEVIETPNLDRLAAQSCTFTRGYVPTALCRPSLMTLATGLYAHQHRTSGNDPAPDAKAYTAEEYKQLRAELIEHVDRVPTIPALLAEEGYLSFQSGKWWEGSYRRGGFTHGMTRGFPEPGGRHGDDGLKIGREGMEPVFDFLDLCRKEEKPFFLWYAPFLPHTPHNPPKELLEKYTAPGRPIQLARYYAMCEWFDLTCGELLEYLEKHDLAENTIVMFVTDNGWIQKVPKEGEPKGRRYGYAPRSKQTPYEGGVRTPIMVRWPAKLEPRRDEETLVSSIDFAPTILTACGAPMPENLPGISLLPICRGEEPPREAIFGEGFAHDIADIDDPSESLLYRWCIEGPWKLILTYPGQLGRYASSHPRTPAGPQLFNLEEDPHETENLADSHPEVVRRLAEKIENWWDPGMEPMGDLPE